MTANLERNLGPQPILELMQQHDLKPHDLVAASPHPITHKMVSRACKGRRLTPNSKTKILIALNQASGQKYTSGDLFTY